MLRMTLAGTHKAPPLQSLFLFVALGLLLFQEYLASVLQVIPGEDYTVYTYFNDKPVRKTDMKPIIAKSGIFACLAGERFSVNV